MAKSASAAAKKSRGNTSARDAHVKMTREKETFKFETFVNIDGEDVKMYAKCSVSYERLTYKIQPVITLIHGWDSEVAAEFDILVDNAVAECQERLAKYREESGIGTQGDLFGEPSES